MLGTSALEEMDIRATSEIAARLLGEQILTNDYEDGLSIKEVLLA